MYYSWMRGLHSSGDSLTPQSLRSVYIIAAYEVITSPHSPGLFVRFSATRRFFLLANFTMFWGKWLLDYDLWCGLIRQITQHLPGVEQYSVSSYVLYNSPNSVITLCTPSVCIGGNHRARHPAGESEYNHLILNAIGCTWSVICFISLT